MEFLRGFSKYYPAGLDGCNQSRYLLLRLLHRRNLLLNPMLGLPEFFPEPIGRKIEGHWVLRFDEPGNWVQHKRRLDRSLIRWLIPIRMIHPWLAPESCLKRRGLYPMCLV